MIGSRFRKVFVVTNVLIYEQWRSYFQELKHADPQVADLIVNLPIKSGLGDGHATLRGIQAAEFMEGARLCRDVVVLWGDVFLPDSDLVDELLSVVLRGSGIVPAVHETTPYVALSVDNKMRCVCADFAKYGEQRDQGYHDQSLFRFDRARLQKSLQHLHDSLWKNGRYISPGGELSLLYTFHQLYNAGEPVYVYETRHSVRTFNTQDEVDAIQQEMTPREKRTVQSGRPPSDRQDHHRPQR